MEFLKRNWHKLLLSFFLTLCFYPLILNSLYKGSGCPDSIYSLYICTAAIFFLALELTFNPPSNLFRPDPIGSVLLFVPYMLLLLAVFVGIYLFLSAFLVAMKRRIRDYKNKHN